MHDLAQQLLRTIRKQQLIKAGDRVAVAVSGGADSVALLLLMFELRSELGIVLSVAHVNHKLRAEESDADEQFVAELAKSHGLEFYRTAAPLEPGSSGIEAAARELRYGFFREISRQHRIDKVATAHTLDDQAETVLLRILRGTGIRGLAGIHLRLPLPDSPDERSAEVVRPLLTFRRDDLRDFLHGSNRIWREDSSNLDPGFLRNRVRHEVLPFLATISRGVAENLADLAEITRGEEDHWRTAHPEVRASGDPIDLERLASLPLAAQRRLVLNWLAMGSPEVGSSLKVIGEILDVCQSEVGSGLELGAGYRIVRGREELRMENVSSRPFTVDFEYTLTLPGAIDIPELKLRIVAELVDPATVSEEDADQLIDPVRVPATLIIRNWRPGDRFCPAHTKEPRKVKDLLNDRHVAGSEKKLWPIAIAGNEIAWMRGFSVPASMRPAPGDSRPAILIRTTQS